MKKLAKSLVYALSGLMLIAMIGLLVNDVVIAQQPPVTTRLLSSGTVSSTLTSNTEIIAAANTGLRYYITEIQCVNTSASTVTSMALKSGTTSMWVIPCPAAGAANAKVVFDPPLRQPTTATAINGAALAAATTVYMSARAYTDK